MSVTFGFSCGIGEIIQVDVDEQEFKAKYMVDIGNNEFVYREKGEIRYEPPCGATAKEIISLVNPPTPTSR